MAWRHERFRQQRYVKARVNSGDIELLGHKTPSMEKSWAVAAATPCPDHPPGVEGAVALRHPPCLARWKFCSPSGRPAPPTPFSRVSLYMLMPRSTTRQTHPLPAKIRRPCQASHWESYSGQGRWVKAKPCLAPKRFASDRDRQKARRDGTAGVDGEELLWRTVLEEHAPKLSAPAHGRGGLAVHELL